MDHNKHQNFIDLTREERNFLKRHGIEEDNISRDTLGRLTNNEEIKNSIHDSNMMNSIKKKMNMKSFSAIYHTSHIPLDTPGKFYLDAEEYAPVELYKSLDNFQLWEVKLHKNSSRMRKGAKGKIVIDYYNTNYGFESEVFDTFHLDKNYIKVPHSNVTQLTKRKNPRITTNFEATITFDNKKFHARIVDLSLAGAKLEVTNNGLLIRGLNINIDFRFGNKMMHLKGKIVYAGLKSIGIVFDHIDDELRHFIERELKTQNIQNDNSHKGL